MLISIVVPNMSVHLHANPLRQYTFLLLKFVGAYIVSKIRDTFTIHLSLTNLALKMEREKT